jgi:prepilin-type N-terminal cleavage/methylation domain-containing protein
MMIRSNKQSGFSLLEVMVVMVVLLIGIMSVVRLFPLGFSINRQSELATRASALTQEEMDRFTSNPSGVMDEVVPVEMVPMNDTNGNFVGYEAQVDTSIPPDDLSQITPAAYPAPLSSYLSDPYFFSDINRFRRIIGERAPIGQNPSQVYMLKCGPFMDVNWDGRSRSLYIYGAPLYSNHQSVWNSGNNSVNIPGVWSRQYAIDYTGSGSYPPSIAFNADGTYDQQYLISYTYTDGSGARHRVVDQIIYVPKALPQPPNGAFLPIWQPLDSLGPIVPGSETVCKMFIEAPNGFDGNPYEYKVVSPKWSSDPNNPVMAPNPFLGANVGAIQFNPNGATVQESTPGAGNVPLTAHIDYDVYDWHIINEDRAMPSSSPYTITLGLRGLLETGDMLDNQTQYQGIFHGQPDIVQNPLTQADIQNNLQYDVLVYNINTGQFLDPTETGGRTPDYIVDKNNGIITFSDTVGAANSGGQFRIYYQAQGQWGMQVQKACPAYTNSPSTSLAMGEYYLGGSPQTRIYFPVIDAGKTVAVGDLDYTDGVNPHHVTNESYQINPFGDPNTGLPYVDIRSLHPDAVSFDTSLIGQAVKNVRGLSFKVRVINTTVSTVNQAPGGNLPVIRWRKFDMDTFLGRANQ